MEAYAHVDPPKKRNNTSKVFQ